jgi:hypothetical protein
VDYRVAKGVTDVNAVLRDVKDKGAIASIYHADAPGGEICMGCRWEPQSNVDMKMVTGVEIVNGNHAMLSAGNIWDRSIAAGARLTAIGGSDNHDALVPDSARAAIGHPTTVVEAENLSVPSIIEGIRNGRVFVDFTGSRDKVIDLAARPATSSSADWTKMGGESRVQSGSELEFRVELINCPNSTVHIFLDGKETEGAPPLTSKTAAETLNFKLHVEAGRHWIRAEVRDAGNSLMLISNPIYISSVSQ